MCRCAQIFLLLLLATTLVGLELSNRRGRFGSSSRDSSSSNSNGNSNSDGDDNDGSFGGRRRAGITLGGGGSRNRFSSRKRPSNTFERTRNRGRQKNAEKEKEIDVIEDDDGSMVNVSVAVVLPHSTFRMRDYNKEILRASIEVRESAPGFHLTPYLDMMQPIPSPTEVLDKICSHFLSNHTAVILYLTDSESYGRHAMASQYFLQLANYLKIPVVAWNADNSAFEQSSGEDRMQLQLAPAIRHQCAAILSLLQRYGWTRFSVITGKIAGHRMFDQTIRDMVSELNALDGGSSLDRRRSVLHSLFVSGPDDLAAVARSEARVFLLYSTHQEAVEILRQAASLGLTGKAYVWVVTQSVIASSLDPAPDVFPLGMLGVHFRTDSKAMMKELRPAFSVIGHALNKLGKNKDLSKSQKQQMLACNVSCHGEGDVRWGSGQSLFKLLKSADVQNSRDPSEPSIQFDRDGNRRAVKLRIVNLQPSGRTGDGLDSENFAEHKVRKKWEEIGVWQSWNKKSEDAKDAEIDEDAASSDAAESQGDRAKAATNFGSLDINDIVWPGLALKPPEGVPEKRFVRASFLEEDPYVMLGPPSSCRQLAGNSNADRGVLCQMVPDDKFPPGLNVTREMMSDSSEYFRCCSGFCVDLLLKFSRDLSFDFKMVRVRDGKWGGVNNGQWNGLVAELINHETDIVMTSLKINSGRESVIAFSVPFLETGITILVAKRTGIISPTAFLEPFDTASWMLVALVVVQVAAGCIFLFEWLSPSGYDLKTYHAQGRFSLMRTLWLVWAVLFQAAVNVDCPRGYTSRFMAYIWASFALIFLAIYTANLAAFMITREEFPNLSGVEDHRLTNPLSQKPPFTFGTIPNGATDYVMKNNFPHMHAYMKHHNRSTVKEGFKAVKSDALDAFIYDATVLEYLVGQDDECNILTVGSWYAMTGYGVGFPKKSKWIDEFNKHLMQYRVNGDLERMQRFWFTGACKPRKRRQTSSKPLALAQFMSAFLLLGIGITMSVFLLLFEHGYFSYLRPYLKELGGSNLWGLISLSIAESVDREDHPKDAKKDAKKPQTKRRDDAAESDKLLLQQQQQQMQQHEDCCCDDPVCAMAASTARRELASALSQLEELREQLRVVAGDEALARAEGRLNDEDDDEEEEEERYEEFEVRRRHRPFQQHPDRQEHLLRPKHLLVQHRKVPPNTRISEFETVL